jgi:hypothetical protein
MPPLQQYPLLSRGVDAKTQARPHLPAGSIKQPAEGSIDNAGLRNAPRASYLIHE